MKTQMLWMLQYHLGGPAITCRTVTHLEFFYAESREAVQQQVEAFLREQQARCHTEIFQELLTPCEHGAVVERWFLPPTISSLSQEAARVEFHWRKRAQWARCKVG